MILGIAGQIGSGKDTIADYLCNFYDFKRASFADSVKESISKIFNWDLDLLKGNTTSSRKWRETVDVWWAEQLGVPNLTPRWVLQNWATEVCRDNFHQDIWILSLTNKLRSTTDNIVITDCRFPNEISAIKKLNGITCRVERGEKPIWYEDAIAYNKGPSHIGWALSKHSLNFYNIHVSEYSSVGLEYDYTINNNGTISELYSEVENILKNHI